MPGTLATRDLLVADEEHVRQAADVVERTADESRLGFKVATSDGDVVLPDHLSSFVTHVIQSVATGGTIQVRSMPEEVSTTVAADHLGISRPTLMKMIRQGDVRARLVGSHHRLKWSDVEELEMRRSDDRKAAARRLRDLGCELGD
ncbi:MAG: helix-turn-helix domain-containing protein [Actinobacteria bacterium]|nr:helix-turn-helix domain-containing protein [Actinomycetota bacterium]